LARPYIANAAAMTATVWWVQGFAQEERVIYLIEAVGLAFAITALITFGLANITPRRRRQSVRRSKSPGGSAVKSAAR